MLSFRTKKDKGSTSPGYLLTISWREMSKLQIKRTSGNPSYIIESKRSVTKASYKLMDSLWTIWLHLVKLEKVWWAFTCARNTSRSKTLCLNSFLEDLKSSVTPHIKCGRSSSSLNVHVTLKVGIPRVKYNDLTFWDKGFSKIILLDK